MPDDAVPQPWPTATIPGLVRHERTYLDVLGRPMRGSAQISGAQRAEHGRTVIAPADVTVTIADGLLAVDLPAGTYDVTATLHTVDGQRVRDTETITLA